MTKHKVDISAIVSVSERCDELQGLFSEYDKALRSTGKNYEFIFVLDGPFPDFLSGLQELQTKHDYITVIQLTQPFGEATTLSAGFEHATGDILLTLPAYHQIDATAIPEIIENVGKHDMVIARRWPRHDSKLKRAQTITFHGILNFIAGCSFQDLGCGVRAFKKEIADEIPVYGDQHRFIPLLAERRGFRVKEVKVPQSNIDSAPTFYRSGTYLRRILDILTVFFLVKFTKKPLRFFGLIGSTIFAIGFLVLIYVISQRLFSGVALADRPALLLSSLFVVLGVQLIALGLIAELIIFTHAREIKEYTIDRIFGRSD
jgi:glycosyltransferase involved in cell wall biosynthesis